MTVPLTRLAWSAYVRSLPYPLPDSVLQDPSYQQRPFPSPTLLFDHISMLESMKFDINHSRINLRAQGRTGQKRSAPVIRYEVEDKKLCVRIDDAANPEFWLEFKLPVDELTNKS